MTSPQHRIEEAEFQAFVDGQLSPERRRAVMAFLASHAEESNRMGDYRALNEALHLAYDEVLHEPLPARLRTDRYVRERRLGAGALHWFRGGMTSMVPRLAALGAVALASGVTGWSLNDRMAPPPVPESEATSFTRNAAHAHMLFVPDPDYPVEFGADQQDSLLLWLSERLGQPVRAPSLGDAGYQLVGGRLLPSSGQPAAQLMYEGPQAQRITLYIRGRWAMPSGALKGAQEGTVSYAGEDDGVGMVYWLEGPFAYALIGQMDREQLFQTARTVQQQLEIPAITPVQSGSDTVEKGAT